MRGSSDLPSDYAGQRPTAAGELSATAYCAPASLYVHIPFCLAKCSYCDFSSYPLADSWYAPYVEALVAEISAVGVSWERPALDTAYIGGGTPTVLPADLLTGILSGIREAFRLLPESEVSMEANPGTVNPDLLSALRRAGVNRLSLGVQSFQAPFLRLLARIHSADEAVEAVRMARSAGFGNLNLDLIYGLPGQTLADWQADLDAALALAPEHLSLYALTLEAGTPLTSRVVCGEVPAPDSDLAADMYEEAERRLAQEGYEHYEISNWARYAHPDRMSVGTQTLAGVSASLRCRHNLTYWHNLPYAGCGAAAHSWLRGQRIANVPLPRDFVERTRRHEPVAAESEGITPELERSETMILGLRLTEGVSRAAFAARFGQDPALLYADVIAETEALGLLEVTPSHMRLSDHGRLLGNQVFLRFLP